MGIYAQKGGSQVSISDAELESLIVSTIEKTGKTSGRMLILPPDHTRLNSQAGKITAMIYAKYKNAWKIDIMPALGTHSPMGEKEIHMMFGDTIPLDLFKVHDWRNDVVTVGQAPASLMSELSKNRMNEAVNVQFNKILFDGYDLIISVGQVVPHEVVGMANYTKNLCVGVGGHDLINKSHFLGAISGMESLMGRADTPVRRLYNYACDTFLKDLNIVFMQTVMAKDEATGKMAMRGFFSGNDVSVFNAAARLSVETNLVLLDEPIKKVIVYLDPDEFKSTWLGNKSVYRTRMAIADDGDLIILAPGLKEFGEDKQIDALIRKYGYKGTPATLKAVNENQDIRDNLGAAAHLIHGSSEGRFTITYCPGKGMSRSAVESVGFKSADLDEVMEKYKVSTLKDGYNVVNGEKVFYISNPALGLWALKKNFAE